MMAESLAVFFAAVFEACKKTVRSACTHLFVNIGRIAGVGWTTDPWGSVVLDSPIAAKEVSARCSFVGATYKSSNQQNSNRSNEFGGE